MEEAVKVLAEITKVEVIESTLAFLDSGSLEITAVAVFGGGRATFRVNDRANNRKVYTVGREIDFEVTPR